MSKISPFDYVKSINETKKNLMRTGDSFEDALYERDYNPWVVNQAFSFHLDTILYANQMNMYPFYENIGIISRGTTKKQ